MFQRHFQRLNHTAALRVAPAEAVSHHLQHLLIPHYYRLLHPGKTRRRQPLLLLLFANICWQLCSKCHYHACIASQLQRTLLQVGINTIHRIWLYRHGRFAVKQLGKAGKEQLQMVVQLGHGTHCTAAGTHGVGLVNGNGGRHTLHLIHRGLIHTIQKLTGVGAECFHIAALAFGIEGVEHQTGFPRATRPRHHGQLARANIHIHMA